MKNPEMNELQKIASFSTHEEQDLAMWRYLTTLGVTRVKKNRNVIIPNFESLQMGNQAKIAQRLGLVGAYITLDTVLDGFTDHNNERRVWKEQFDPVADIFNRTYKNNNARTSKIDQLRLGMETLTKNYFDDEVLRGIYTSISDYITTQKNDEGLIVDSPTHRATITRVRMLENHAVAFLQRAGKILEQQSGCPLPSRRLQIT